MKNLIIILTPIILLFSTSCSTWVKSTDGSLVSSPFADKGRNYTWSGGRDAEGKAHGWGTMRMFGGGKRSENLAIQEWRHGEYQRTKTHLVAEKSLKPGFLEGINPEVLIKGGLALGGAAALANQGADSSIINQYAGDVMNERVRMPSSGGTISTPSHTNGGVKPRTFILTPKHPDCFGSSVSGIKSVTVHSSSSISINGISGTAQRESASESAKSVSATLVERVGAGTAVHRFNFTFTGTTSGTYTYSNNATNKICRGSFVTR